MKTRNPFHRQVTRNVVRASEKVVTILEEGKPTRVIGEFINFAANRSTNTIDVPLGGQSGNVHQKRVGATKTWTATFYVGSDASFWEKMMEDEDNGIERPFIWITSTKDNAAKAVGERIREYSECRLTDLNDNDSMTPDGLAIASITGTYEDTKLIQGFNAIQGQI
jgi:hypothetical protein